MKYPRLISALKHSIIPVLAIIIAFTAGFIIRGSDGSSISTNTHVSENSESNVTEWTCSMHPQIRLPNPGKCPICGMDLIPVAEMSPGTGAKLRELRLSPVAEKLAEVRTVPVERRSVARDIRLFGKVTYDETQLSEITSWFPGRIDKLYVEFTGQKVVKNEKLAELYSPDIRNAWEELNQAKSADSMLRGSSFGQSRTAIRSTADAVREKLRLLGLTADQIREFEDSEKPSDHVAVYNTIDGVVVRKNAIEGMYAETGTKLFTVADLSTVWVLLDVYESDLAWIDTGDEVIITTEAYPGERFIGDVSFIDPVVNDRTRSVRVRVAVPNTGDRLKPDMFVRAEIKTAAGDNGSEKSPLVIPASAPLITGERAVVYVASPGEEGLYEGREVVLGHRLGDRYEVKSGLSEGENVVVNGNFKIDSALQILARPSMMNPENDSVPGDREHKIPTVAAVPEFTSNANEGESGGFDVPDAFKSQLDSVYAAYFRVQNALSHDTVEKAKENSTDILAALESVDMTLLDHDAHMAWMEKLKVLRESSQAIYDADTIDRARTSFKKLSDALISVAHDFGTSGNVAVYRFHCPMAFDNAGSDWLQGKPELENPWFGSAMFKCGTLEETISGSPGDASDSGHVH